MNLSTLHAGFNGDMRFRAENPAKFFIVGNYSECTCKREVRKLP